MDVSEREAEVLLRKYGARTTFVGRTSEIETILAGCPSSSAAPHFAPLLGTSLP